MTAGYLGETGQFSSNSNLKKQFSLPSKLGRRKVCVFRGVILYIFGLHTRDRVSNGNDHVQIAISTLTAYSCAVSFPLSLTCLPCVCTTYFIIIHPRSNFGFFFSKTPLFACATYTHSIFCDFVPCQLACREDRLLMLSRVRTSKRYAKVMRELEPSQLIQTRS